MHAYAIMRNHYHLAVETPDANLVEGMHWLQSTFATRFNRSRAERGHLFQGRYQALLVEDALALARVASYIHLNPVRAGIVPAEQVGAFRWSSLGRFLKRERPAWLTAGAWLSALGLEDTVAGWRDYVASLRVLAADSAEQERQGFAAMVKGWAIGTDGWRKAVARDHARLALNAGVASDELSELRRARWMGALQQVLRETGRSLNEVRNAPKGAPWKIALAATVRRESGAAHAWLAEMLSMGSPNSVRSYLSRARQIEDQQISA